MTSQTETQTAAPPSLSKLAKTTVIVLAIAGVILVTIVLPAEYAIDPVGTGRWLGLTQIAAPPPVLAEAAATSDSSALAPVQNGAVGAYPAEFKFDVFEIALQPYEYVEYKYRLEKGATMVYSWAANAALIQDFHGERAVGTGDDGPAEESFDKQNRRNAHGSFTAPFSGIHGWYWENPGSEPITVRLTTSGFYSAAVEIRSDRTRQNHSLRPLDTLSPLGDASSGAAVRPQGSRGASR
jgi:hypothetical protein